MGGGLLQIIAYGSQDIYLTGNPQISFFKLNYKRHTNFAIKNIEIRPNNTDYNKKISIVVPKNIDLMSKSYLKVELLTGLVYISTIETDSTGLTDINFYNYYKELGHQIIDYIEIEIGGKIIDKHYGIWLSIWNELSLNYSKKDGYNKLIGNELSQISDRSDNSIYYDTETQKHMGAPRPQTYLGSVNETNIFGPYQYIGKKYSHSIKTKGRFGFYDFYPEFVVPCNGKYFLYIPLQFWFCRYIGLSLPIIALKYNEVKFNIKLHDIKNFIIDAEDLKYNSLSDIQKLSGLYDGQARLDSLDEDFWNASRSFVKYPEYKNVCIVTQSIILDTDEKRRFSTNSHEYLIEQLQYQETNFTSSEINQVKLNFNHPIKELIWVYQFNEKQHPLDFSTGDETTSPLSTLKIIINGADKIKSRDDIYFSQIQPYTHHTCIPESPGIYCYSFSLNPEEHQPSGSCNFTRLNDVKFEFSLKDSLLGKFSNIKIFAKNYNVLKIMSGIGGLSFKS
jgi:hypothetical protein